MKNILLITTLLGFNLSLCGQTIAADFTANDCLGVNHHLFADLDAGKAVVIVWVMPCATCINGALTAQTEVQNARAQNPGRIVYYMCDDYGNTNCTTLSSWAAINGITDAIVLSNPSVNMNPYGDPGMPKVIVVGGSQHTVFYNQNEPSITATGIRNGIASALAAPVGLNATGKHESRLVNFPNPAASSSNFSIDLINNSHVTLNIYNGLGQLTKNVFNGALSSGHHNFSLDVSALPNGIYFVNFSDGTNSKNERLIVNH